MLAVDKDNDDDFVAMDRTLFLLLLVVTGAENPAAVERRMAKETMESFIVGFLIE